MLSPAPSAKRSEVHPKDDEVYPIDTVVRLKKTGEFAIIVGHGFLKDGVGFLHYEGIIEGRGDGHYALYHNDIELECEARKST